MAKINEFSLILINVHRPGLHSAPRGFARDAEGAEVSKILFSVERTESKMAKPTDKIIGQLKLNLCVLGASAVLSHKRKQLTINALSFKLNQLIQLNQPNHLN
jgi:hypothetical protein